MVRSRGREPVRALRRRLSVRRRVKFPKTPFGMVPERETPGRRRAVTRLLSHLTPAQLQGEVCLMSQRNVRPPTAERRERRAALSALRSWVEGRGRERRRVVRRTERIVMEELGKTRIV